MKSNLSHTKWLRTLANFSYMLGIAFLIASLAINSFPAHPALAQGNSGSIWTTTGSCGSPQDANSYSAGQHVFIHGSGFDAGDYGWSIKGKPGGASGDPGQKVAGGSYSVDASGAFCFDAYTVHADDWGEYQVKFGSKGDNFNVEGSSPSTGSPEAPTNTPTTIVTEVPNIPLEATATPTDPPTNTPTPEPTQPTATPTNGPTGESTDTPTDAPTDGPTVTPTDVQPGDPQNTPTQQATVTDLPVSLTISSLCGPNAKHVNWWKISNPYGYVVPVTWEIMPSGAPADFVSLPANSDYEFSTVKVTEHDSLVVYLDPQGQQLAGSADAAEGCSNSPRTPGQTPPPGNPGPSATLSSSASPQPALFPVTGADLGSSAGTKNLFFSLGIGFIGLGLVLGGIARERKNWDI